jgi:hypothetical protein
MKSTLLKRTAWIVLMCGMAGPTWAGPAQPGVARDFGVGAIVGDPTGLTAKYWTHERRGPWTWRWPGTFRETMTVWKFTQTIFGIST